MLFRLLVGVEHALFLCFLLLGSPTCHGRCGVVGLVAGGGEWVGWGKVVVRFWS